MKKLVALAVASAFIAPVYAAEISISGDQEFSYKDANGASVTKLDGDFNIKASTETSNGWKVSADINVSAAAGDDGGASLTIAGPFGTVDMGDTSSAVDAIDDKTDWGYELTNGSPNLDAAILWTLPTMVEGLTVNASLSADSNTAASGSSPSYGTTTAGTGLSAAYKVGSLGLGYGLNEDDDGDKYVVYNVTYSVAGINLAFENFAYTTGTTETDYTTVGATYALNDTTLAIEKYEVSVDGATASSDVTTIGVHQNLGGGVVAFIEQTDDSQDSTAEITAIGVTFKF